MMDQKAFQDILAKMGFSDPKIIERLEVFTDELLTLILGKAEVGFPEPNLAPLMATMATVQIAGMMRHKMHEALMAMATKVVVEHLDDLTVDRLRDIVGNDVPQEFLEKIISEVHAAVVGGDPELLNVMNMVKGQQAN